jgi:brefeldin A-resistance guanine nucleotide exchange factor 1
MNRQLRDSPSPPRAADRRGAEDVPRVWGQPAPAVAVDAATLVINECMVISLAMRKLSRWSQSGVAAILGTGDIFGADYEEFPRPAAAHGGHGGAHGGAHSAARLGRLGGRLSQEGRGSHDGRGHGAPGAPAPGAPGASDTPGHGGAATAAAYGDVSGPGSPLLQSFFQLRAILSGAPPLLASVDALTLLQPFLLVVRLLLTLGHITLLALAALAKFLDYGIVARRLRNVQAAVVQVIALLTHCRFEAADQSLDDAVLLKVLRLLEQILALELAALLPDESVLEVVQTCLLLACNKKRSEVLRRAAEMAMFLVTVRVFGRLGEVPPERGEVTINLGVVLPEDALGTATPQPAAAPPVGALGSAVPSSAATAAADAAADTLVADAADAVDARADAAAAAAPTADAARAAGAADAAFGLPCITDFLSILISMVSPTNQYQHMESTRVFALSLVTTAIEVAGHHLPAHPSLMALVSDLIFKYDLQIVTTLDSPALLQAALQLFTTLAIVLGPHLKSQLELALHLVFKLVLPRAAATDRLKTELLPGDAGRLPQAKEMLVELMSLLWTRSPLFFTHLFINYDCDFDRLDLALQLLRYLCELLLPESATVTTDNVPPICLELVLSFIALVNDRARTAAPTLLHRLLQNKNQKVSFVKCTEALNASPLAGLRMLHQRGFIHNLDDDAELAHFFFLKLGRLNKKVLGEYLAKPANVAVLRGFINLFEFGGLRVDEALRVLLKSFRLPGESQQIERVVETFAERYVRCQEEADAAIAEAAETAPAAAETAPAAAETAPDAAAVRPDRDAVFILSYSIILLNTDLHNPQVKRQMDLDAYKRNLRGTYNGADFPEWYLAKIYASIKEREIIMPEEHHGTDKWFDDAWHNLVSSEPAAAAHDVAVDPAETPQFDRVLFAENVDMIISTLVRVFVAASDDHITTRLMSSIDKCASICMAYGLADSVDKLIGELARQTRLARDAADAPADADATAALPITEIQIENADVITVSEMAVWFGRDFKAQIALVVLFRLVKKVGRVTPSWRHVLAIMLTLLENCLVSPNVLAEFQKALRLGPLPRVKPQHVINRNKPLRDSGLLSTFLLFLKGYLDVPPEPTDQEVESTLSTIDCVKSIGVPAVLRSALGAGPAELAQLARHLVGLLPENTAQTKRFYESEVLFIFEVAVYIATRAEEARDVVWLLLQLTPALALLARGRVRLAVYQATVLRAAPNEAALGAFIESVAHLDPEAMLHSGALVIRALAALADRDAWSRAAVVASEQYWTAFRVLLANPAHAGAITDLLAAVVASGEGIHPVNYMTFLGLLDELSLLGAVGLQFEQGAPEGEYPRELIECLKRCIRLTAELSALTGGAQFDDAPDLHYSLYQALAHQCFNPCREVRAHALGVLQLAVLQLKLGGRLTAEGIFEYVLFPLLTELAKEEVVLTDPLGFARTRLEAIKLVSRVFLNVQGGLGDGAARVWLGILDHMVTFHQLKQEEPPVQASRLATPGPSGEEEAGLEVLKNMVLVLQDSGVLVAEKRELWVETARRVAALDAPLERQLLGSDAPPEAAAEVEATS